MLERLFLDILSRGELSLSAIIVVGILLYIYIKNVDSKNKDTANSVKDIQDELSTTTKQYDANLSEISAQVTKNTTNIENIDERLKRIEQKLDRLEELFFLQHQSKTKKVPTIGNGHKHLLAKITSAVAKSISDSYDVSFKHLFNLWISNKIPKTEKGIEEIFISLIDTIKEIQQQAISLIPKQPVNIQECVYKIISTTLLETEDYYAELAKVIIALLSTAKTKEEQTKALDIAISTISEAESEEINIYAEYFSNIFTETIKEELISGRSFIDIFYEKLKNQEHIHTLIRNIRNTIAQQINKIEKINKQLKDGVPFDKLKLKNSTSKKRKKNSVS